MFQALTFRLSAIGNEERILAFFEDMDVTQNLLDTLIVTSASLNIDAGSTLSMELTVYTHAS